MKQVLVPLFVLISFGSSSAIRARLEIRDVHYVANGYSEEGEPQDFEYDARQVEKVAVDEKRGIVYAIGNQRLTVFKILRNQTLRFLHTEIFDGFTLHSVQVCRGIVSVTARMLVDENQGIMFVFNGYMKGATGNLHMIHSIELGTGSNPAHHVVSRDCRKIVVALQRAGRVAVITFGNFNLNNPDVKLLKFSAYDNEQEQERLRKEWFFLTDSFQESFEQAHDPDWVCLNKKETKAYVMLQRNNGIAVADLRPGQEGIVSLNGMGLKSWFTDNNKGLDGSDTPKEARVQRGPIFSTYSAEQISCQTIGKKDCIFVAGEGRLASGSPLKNFNLEDNLPPYIKNEAYFGNLNVIGPNLQTDPEDDNKLNTIVAFGSRDFSLFCGKNNLSLVADTGSDLEVRTMGSRIYNAFIDEEDRLSDSFDITSVFGGPEPKAVITTRVCSGRYILMVGSTQRPGRLWLYTLDTRHIEAGFVFQDKVDGYESEDSVFTDIELYDAKQLYLRDPEGLAFVHGRGSRDKLMVVSGSKITSTVELFNIRIDCKGSTSRKRRP